ncbi:MAG TPA: hypothetical protein VFZ58_03610 [Candidatus Saccharimonadales bacterium]
MFKKIVSTLPFSPALIGQLGFYAKRLKQEELTRRLGLIFTVLALIVQSLAIFAPPEAQAVASGQNIVFQGVRDKADMLRIYDSGIDNGGHHDIQQIFTAFGITRADLANANTATFNSRDFNLGIWSVGRYSFDAGTPYEKAVAVPGTNSTVFARKLWRFDSLPYTKQNGSTYKGLVGKRAVDGKWFSVSFDCGNIAFTDFPPPPPQPASLCTSLSTPIPLSRTKFRLVASASATNGATISRYDFTIADKNNRQVFAVNIQSNATSATADVDIQQDGSYTARVTVQTSMGARTGDTCAKPFVVSPEPRCPTNQAFPISSPECKPCPSDSTIWYKDEKCKPEYEASKTVANLTQNKSNANDTTANPNDKLQYTLKVKNTGKDSGSYVMRENLADVIEYADVTDAAGGILEKDANGTDIMTWPTASIKPGQIITKVITVQLKKDVPASPQNVGNPESYNCKMTNSFGNTTNVMVACPPEKLIENTVKQLPATGPTENVIFSGIILTVVVYFYARSQQINKEVRIVRKEFAAGTI